MRVAIVHDWLTGMRGGEKVLSLLCGLMPRADLLTLLHVRGACDERIEGMRIITSRLDELPGVRHYYRHLLAAMPMAIEEMDASRYDLIVSCSHCVAKGVIRRAGSAHVCYCFTPMRYIWNQRSRYGQSGPLAGLAIRLLGGYLRAWDRRSAAKVDLFLANSQNVAGRIDRVYNRDARVVYSPIDTEFFTGADCPREDFYLMVTALSPYKCVDQAVAAFAGLGRELRIIGSGPMERSLRRAAPSNVKLLGWRSDEEVRRHYRRCRAVIFPGEEDFGLVPLEAMACGAPVIAYGAGGALETVLDGSEEKGDGPTGVLYTPQTPRALEAAVRRFERTAGRFQRQRLIAWARRFSQERFISQFKQAVRPLLAARGLDEPWSNNTTS